MDAEPDISTFRFDRPGIRKILGDLEAEIMEFIWTRPVAQGTIVRDVFEVLYERRRIAYTTVMNTMTRLAKKHLLRVEKQDQAYIYYPTLTKKELISRLIGYVLEDLFVSFSDATQEGINTLSNKDAATRAQQVLDDIQRRRVMEEGE
jgi:predicted transcriptional regulator